MMKHFRPTAIILSLLFLTFNLYAQDSTKKTNATPVKPATLKPAVIKSTGAKPAVKYNPYATKPSYPVKATATPAGQQTPSPAAATVQQPAMGDPSLLNDKSLNGQYRYLLTRVYHYQQPLIAALWKNFSDTLNVSKRKLADANAKLAFQTKKTDTLQQEISAKEQNLSASNSMVDRVSLLGMPISKATYNLIMWGLVIGFGVIAAIVILRSGAHSREAKYRIKLYNELEEDYKTYKAKANEKEKKLARELQTERNKLEELRGNV